LYEYQFHNGRMEVATKTPLPNLGFVSIFQFILQLTPNILLFSLIAIYSLRITHIKGEEIRQMRITAS
jgi:hypothetical protein